jgi:hypothetical protein
MNIINGNPAKAASTHILHSTLLVLLFLSQEFKAFRLAELFLFLGFESKFYLETWRIVLLIFAPSAAKYPGNNFYVSIPLC